MVPSPCEEKTPELTKRDHLLDPEVRINVLPFPFQRRDPSVLDHSACHIACPEDVLILVQVQTTDGSLMCCEQPECIVSGDVLDYDLLGIRRIDSQDGFLVMKDFETVFTPTQILSNGLINWVDCIVFGGL
jgi:hypothetical protein